MKFYSKYFLMFSLCDEKEKENCAWKFDESSDEAWWG